MPMDKILINGKPLLDIVDVESSFINSIFINRKNLFGQWNYFIDCWDSFYTVCPDIIIFKRETSFASEVVRESAK